ncbi:hypothetical protein [Roseiterribacter gracilis]
MNLLRLCSLGLFVATSAVAQTDEHAHHHMPAPAPKPAADPHAAHKMPAQPAPAVDEHAGHDMSQMSAHVMQGFLGAYPMTREASGTSWQPDTTPHDGVHAQLGNWSAMAHGFVTAIYDQQGGPRGGGKVFSTSMLMGMASRPVGDATWGVRTMVSLDPVMGKRGYPLLFQTGEAANGQPLVDRQHPHDAFMELATTLSQPIGEGRSVFVYAGLPGEPALGPTTYMHRLSGLANPETPLAHHWLDSTHVTFGVVTAGVVLGTWKLEASGFKGREPDEKRWNIESPKLDSWSARVSWNPDPRWSLQVSYGELTSPEQLEAEIDQHRFTASASYTAEIAPEVKLATTLAYGRNQKQPGGSTDAVLLESAAIFADRHTVFARYENVDKDELFPLHSDPLHDRGFRVNKLSVGYQFTTSLGGPFKLDLGGVVSGYAYPGTLDRAYGSSPVSGMVFGRIRFG